jgi:hypothetical protein
MSSDPRKRQKKLEKRASKRKEKKHEIARATPTGLPEQLRAATRYPVHDCFISEHVWTHGLGSVMLSRELPNGSIALAVFLVDRSCLGIKDAFARIEGEYTYQRQLTDMRSQSALKEASPACVRKLVEGAAAYAEALGLHPHPDYAKVKLIFGDIDAAACPESYEFGKDGKPFFAAGPHDTPARCRQILATLERTCGTGNYDFLLPMQSGGELTDEQLDYLDADDMYEDD